MFVALAVLVVVVVGLAACKHMKVAVLNMLAEADDVVVDVVGMELELLKEHS